MRKKVYFSEIVFTNEYYIDGVNILDDRNIEYLGNIDIDLKVNLSFSKIDNAKLVKIKDLNIDIVIAEVKDFKIICYLKSNILLKVANHPRNQESLYKNYNLLEEYVINKLKKLTYDNIVYSPDYKTRGFVSYENGLVSLKYQRLEIEDEEGFYFYEDVSSDDFWSWEDLSGISYFDTLENAKKELDEITFSDEKLEELKELYEIQYEKTMKSAKKLSDLRKKVAEDFSELPFFIGWDAQEYINKVNEISTSDISFTVQTFDKVVKIDTGEVK